MFDIGINIDTEKENTEYAAFEFSDMLFFNISYAIFFVVIILYSVMEHHDSIPKYEVVIVSSSIKLYASYENNNHS